MPRALILAPRHRSRVSRPVKGAYAEDQRTVAAIKALKQEHQQDAGGLTRRPHGPIEHLVVAGVVVMVAASHDPQRGGHGALARSQDRAHQQQLSLLPGRVGEQRCGGGEYRYNGVGQGEHGWTFPSKVGSGQLTRSLYFF